MKNFFSRGKTLIDGKGNKFSCSFSFLSIIFLILISLSLCIYSPIEAFSFFETSKSYLDLLFIALQLLMFYLFEKQITYSKHNTYLKSGLIIWTAGVIIGLVNEALSQPQWIILSLGKPLKLSGLFILLLSCYKHILHLEKLYFGASIEALYDDLTTLPNRRHFNATLEKLKNLSFGLILIDIDRFKKINDKYGHDKGDKILKELGQKLKTYSSEKCIPARIGGEEFAVIMYNTTTHEIFTFAKKIMADANTIIMSDNTSLSISIGLGVIKKNEPIMSLVKRTDKALYKSKNTGRGRIEWSEYA